MKKNMLVLICAIAISIYLCGCKMTADILDPLPDEYVDGIRYSREYPDDELAIYDDAVVYDSEVSEDSISLFYGTGDSIDDVIDFYEEIFESGKLALDGIKDDGIQYIASGKGTGYTFEVIIEEASGGYEARAFKTVVEVNIVMYAPGEETIKNMQGLWMACGMSGTLSDDYRLEGKAIQFSGSKMDIYDGFEKKAEGIEIVFTDDYSFFYVVDGVETKSKVSFESIDGQDIMAVTIDGSETYFEKTTIDNMLFYNYPRVINIWSFSDEAVGIIEKFMEMHPDFGYDIKTTVIENTSSSYTAALDQALALGGANAPDIYFAEAVFVYKYTQGDASGFAASYEDLGIDVHTLAEEAEIAPYIFEIGTNKEGEVAALCYQSTGGAFIYRRSIAIDTWGTDDPDKIKDIVGPGWDKFLEAAADLKDKGYCIVSSSEDIWTVIENSAEKGWIADGRLYIDPQREAFLDISRQLEDNGYYNNTQKWGEDWFADMNETGENEVFGFFGPAWFVNFVLCQSAGDTFGDWAVCVPPTDYHWGGTWALANKDSKMKEAIAQIIEWITLDSSETGLQYMLATGTMDEDDGPKDSVASGKIMAASDGTLEFLGGQDMFEIFLPAAKAAKAQNLTQYDEVINALWLEEVREYTAGNKTREQAIADFRQQVADRFDIIVD